MAIHVRSPQRLMLKLGLALIAAGIVLAVYPTSGPRAQGDAIGQRQDTMESFGDAVEELNDMTKSDSAYDAERAAELATQIRDRSENLGTLFPEGSTHEDSRALPAIWENWDTFAGYAQGLHAESGKLVDVIQGGADRGAVRHQFFSMAQNCRNCHESFREER